MTDRKELARKLAKRYPEAILKAKRDKARASGARARTSSLPAGSGGGRNNTYSFSDDHGDVRLVYVLRGDAGTYREEFYGDVLEGNLAYVSDLTWSTEYGDFRGFVYNADDEFGQYCYFFGDDEIEGLYLLSIAAGLYEQGAPPPFIIEESGLVSRTQP